MFTSFFTAEIFPRKEKYKGVTLGSSVSKALTGVPGARKGRFPRTLGGHLMKTPRGAQGAGREDGCEQLLKASSE